VRVIHTEAEFRPIYEGQPLFRELDRFLRRSGFRRERFLYRDEWFGNVVYTRRTRDRLVLPAWLDRILRRG
ncbi:MAG: hypothetical protein QHI48_09140, partial [Bacteroidota bacterium]|nr:hypothetical protein [Bacteroidota bacterium]